VTPVLIVLVVQPFLGENKMLTAIVTGTGAGYCDPDHENSVDFDVKMNDEFLVGVTLVCNSSSVWSSLENYDWCSDPELARQTLGESWREQLISVCRAEIE